MKYYNNQDELEKEIKSRGFPDYIRGDWTGPGYYTFECDTDYRRDVIATFYNPEKKLEKLKEEIKDKLSELHDTSFYLNEKYKIYHEFDWGGGDKNINWLRIDNIFEYLWDDNEDFVTYFTKEEAENIVKSFSEVGFDLKIKLVEK